MERSLDFDFTTWGEIWYPYSFCTNSINLCKTFRKYMEMSVFTFAMNYGQFRMMSYSEIVVGDQNH